MSALSTFKATIRDIANRGTTLDGYLPTAIKNAGDFLEKNYTFHYMTRFRTFNIDADASNPRFIDLPTTRLKRIDFIRYADDDGLYNIIEKAKPQDFDEIEDGAPTHYWLDGNRSIVLNNTPDEDIDGVEIGFVEFTSWPTNDDAEPWLLANAEPVMIAGTMLELAPYMKGEDITAQWQPQFDRHNRALLLSMDEMDTTGEAPIMRYGREQA